MATGRRAKILNLEPDRYSPAARAVLAAAALVDDGPLERSELLARISGYDALIVRFGHKIDKAVLEAGAQLRAVGCAATGTDHIDVPFANSKGITVVSLAGETEFLRSIPASAEYSWALLLALTRRVVPAVEAARQGNWQRDLYRGHDLAGKTLAIVGCGRIGEKVVRYGQAFNMTVIAYDPYRAALPNGVLRAATLNELMGGADVIMVHVPLNAETHKLVDRAALAAARRGAILVNTSRGGVVDEQAVLDALVSGQLSGAALDVLSNEDHGSIMTNPLLAYARDHDNVLITPHIAGATAESMEATEIFIARKLVQALQSAS